jgi:ankyrin repeat protein
MDLGGETAVFYAVRYGFIPALEMLLTQGANPDIADNRGDTPLTYAVRQSLTRPDHWQRIIGLLITHGADPTILNHQGENAVCIARRQGKSPIYKMLRDYDSRKTGCHALAGELIGAVGSREETFE